MTRPHRRRTFAQIRAEERATVSAFIDHRADRYGERAAEATALRAVASDIRADLVTPIPSKSEVRDDA
jgi:hypothetical protein